MKKDYMPNPNSDEAIGRNNALHYSHNEGVIETIKELRVWANSEKDKLVMKWDKDKIQSWVYDKLLEKLTELETN